MSSILAKKKTVADGSQEMTVLETQKVKVERK